MSDDASWVAPGKFSVQRDGRTYLVHIVEVESELVEPCGFGVDPGDSAALLKLRQAIDEHLPAYEPEATDGDYEGLVRKAGRICELASRWRACDEDMSVPPHDGGCPHLDELADALDDGEAVSPQPPAPTAEQE